MRYRFSLVDFNANALSVALQRFCQLQDSMSAETLANFYLHDVLDPFPNTMPKGDISYSLGLLEHFQPDEVVKVLKNQMNCCPMVMSAVPNANCAYYMQWKANMEKEGTWPYGYEVPMTLEMLTAYYEEAGLEVVDDTTFGDNFPAPDDEKYLLAVLGKRKV